MERSDIDETKGSLWLIRQTPPALPDPLYPDAGRPPRLAADLCALFARQPEVQRIVMFGSQARGTWDRWSDLDLLLVTRAEHDYQDVLATLRATKPIIHHAAIRRSTEHPGRHVIGIVFGDESVFHTLDLNFMPLAVYQQVGARTWFDRFGLTLDCYMAPGPEEPIPVSIVNTLDPVPDPQEQALEAANWWLKRAVRRVLRTAQGHDELAVRAQAVQAAMTGLPERCTMLGGDPCCLAHIYLTFATRLLTGGP